MASESSGSHRRLVDFTPLHETGGEDAASVERMQPIGRFPNAAEAGYFAHELERRRSFTVEMEAEEQFDAVLGFWSTRFVLRVPQSDSVEAARLLQNLLDGAEPEQFYAVETPVHGEGPTEAFVAPDRFPADSGSRVHWVPIVLTLAAGTLAVWGVRKTQQPAPPNKPAAPAKPHRNDLWDRLSSTESRLWIQLDAAGRRVRELEFDPQKDTAELRERLDAEGDFERRRTIHR